MGRQMQDKQSGSDRDNHHPECSRSLLHIIKHHPFRHFIKRLAYRKDGGERSSAGTIIARRDEAFSDDKKKNLNLAKTRNSDVEEKATPHSSVGKNTVRSQIKALIKEISKKRSRHNRSSTHPILSQSIHITSTHEMEQSTIDRFSETVLTDESTRINRCVLREVKDEKQCRVEDNARKHTSGASTHFSKHFVGALETINMNKDLSLTFRHNLVSPLVYHFHKPQEYGAKMTLNRSVSFPSPDSSKTQGYEPIGNGSPPKGQGKLFCGNTTQKSVQFESSKEFCEQVMSSIAKWRVNGTVESRKESLRVTMDAVIHKLPQGHGISDELKKEMFKKLTDPNIAICNVSDPSTYSFPMHHRHSIRRIRSLQEPLESYCQLHENSFNTEARHPQSEQLKLRTEKAHSPLRMPIPLKRILSLPDLQSFSYASQNGEVSDILSLTKPTIASGDGTVSSESIAYQKKRLDLNVHSKSQLQLDTPVEDLTQENLVSVDENDLVISNIVGSGSDCISKTNGKLGIIIDDFGHSSLKNGGTFNDQDIGQIKEYKDAIAASDSKFNLGPVDRLDDVAEQQVANLNSLKVTETTENDQKVEILTKELNYEIPHFHVDTKDKAEFNYVKYVLEISGLTGNDFLSAWHSSDHPVDPLLYEEMEGDPDFCTQESGQCNHHVLFDLINETLLEIYGRSHCYHPYIHPMPVGCHTLHQVWTHMTMSKSLRSKVDQTIDDHVSRDLAKCDGWVNPQSYAECVGLELEDLIFHDLLEEIVWDLA